MKVELSKEAQTQVDQIDAWWRANRVAAPELFTNELEQALADLGAMPSLGTIYQVGRQSIRRLLLRRSHYHLYFIEQPSLIFVLAVWSAYRGSGPTL